MQTHTHNKMKNNKNQKTTTKTHKPTNTHHSAIVKLSLYVNLQKFKRKARVQQLKCHLC